MVTTLGMSAKLCLLSLLFMEMDPNEWGCMKIIIVEEPFSMEIRKAIIMDKNIDTR